MKTRDEYVASRMNIAREKILIGEESADLATLLIKEKSKDGRPMFTDHQIASQLYGFLFAGHETTAAALQWILYYMGEAPDWVDQIRVRQQAISNAEECRRKMACRLRIGQ